MADAYFNDPSVLLPGACPALLAAGTIYSFQSSLNLELRCLDNHSAHINKQPYCYFQNIENLGKEQERKASLKSAVSLLVDLTSLRGYLASVLDNS